MDFSCIKESTKIVNLTLPALYNTNEISGICDILENWKRQYVKQLQGIVVGYKNVSLTSKRGYVKLDSAVIYCSVKATFEIFYPTIGSIIKGKINRISQDYIGCLVHDTINVTVHQTSDLVSDISKYIALDRFILFQITRMNFKSKVIHVKGKITEECVTLMKESGMLSDDIDNNALECSSPDLFANSITSYEKVQTTGEVDTSTDTSSQTSSHKKKKKHKKSKDKIEMSPSLISAQLENDIDQVELTQSCDNTKKKKRKKSDTILTSPSNAEDETELVHPKKKLKSEATDINQDELFKSPDKTRKRKRKKSDISTSLSNSLENESVLIHPKKKMKKEEQISWMNDTMEFLEKNSSLISSDTENVNNVSASSSNINSSNIENSETNVESSSSVKKKKHKKSKSKLETSSSFSDHVLQTEINEFTQSSSVHTSPPKSTPSSHVKSQEDILTSPVLLDESVADLKSETEPTKIKKKKKDKISDKSKSHKKKKDKLKKGSKKDKKKKLKVISTKKKLHGHNVKLKKKKNKDKKSKEGKKNKSKSKKTKSVPE